jgi:hypothetical protein
MSRYIRTLGLVLAAGLAWSAFAGRAEAGSLDKALLDRSGDIVAYLKQKKINNVGVLPFRVKLGERQALFAGGPLATNLPRRVENALIMTMDPDEGLAVGVIRDAAATAGKGGVDSYRTKERAFRKLFALDYPLAWGDRTVKPDAFLTGEVHNAGADRGKTKVVVNLITPASWRTDRVVPAKTWTFEARTDTMLAADLGYNFSLSPLVLKRGSLLGRRDQLVVEQVTREDEAGDRKPTQSQTQQHTPDNIAGFSFELHYGGVRQKLTPMSESQGAKAPVYTAPPAPVGSPISMYLTRTDGEDRKLGLLVLVNGKSTLDLEDAEPISCRKWIYDVKTKGRRDRWDGFYQSGEGGKLSVLPFKALTAEESEAKAHELGGRAGWIDVFVFASKEGSPAVDEDEKELLITTRGMPRAKAAPRTLKELRAALLNANNLKQRERLVVRREGGLILHEMEAVEAGTFSTDELPHPVVLGHLSVRYYDGRSRKAQP